MNESDAIEVYKYELKISGDKTPPYSRESIEFAISYPLTYKSAYKIVEHFGKDKAGELLRLACMVGMNPLTIENLERIQIEKFNIEWRKKKEYFCSLENKILGLEYIPDELISEITDAYRDAESFSKLGIRLGYVFDDVKDVWSCK